MLSSRGTEFLLPRQATAHYADVVPGTRSTTTLHALFGDGAAPGTRFDLIKLDTQGALTATRT